MDADLMSIAATLVRSRTFGLPVNSEQSADIDSVIVDAAVRLRRMYKAAQVVEAERDEARQHLLARDAECARWQGELAACRQEVERLREWKESEQYAAMKIAVACLGTGAVPKGVAGCVEAVEVICKDNASLRERAEKAEAALRSLASYVGNGGYNAETVDVDVFEAKIRDGIDTLVRAECERLNKVSTSEPHPESDEHAAAPVFIDGLWWQVSVKRVNP